LEILQAFIRKEITSLYLQATIESEALQLRKLLELISYSSLIAHKQAYKAVRSDIAKDWHADRILSKIEEVNPLAYPIPTDGVENGTWNVIRGGYLTRKQFSTLYKRCNAVLHSKNPFAQESASALAFHRKVPEYTSRIEKLLTEHRVRLPGSQDQIHVIAHFFTGRAMELRLLSLLPDNA
jgi:hypothetical protein